MRIRISPTHGFDLLYKALMFPIGLLASLAAGWFGLSALGLRGTSAEVLGCLAGVDIWFALCALMSRIATFLYVRLRLRTPISIADVRVVHFLFNGSRGVWYPMTELRNVATDNRRELLLRFADSKRVAKSREELDEETDEFLNKMRDIFKDTGKRD